LRKLDFAAIVTGVSLIPLASFPNVLPVQGAINSKSSRFLGPIGSTGLNKIVQKSELPFELHSIC